VLSARILEPFGEAAAFVRHLRERPDGTGVPDGLPEHEIPIGAAIIGCAEAYDAMTHHRAWRPSRSRRDALSELASLKGEQFVPRVVDALHRVIEERGAP
jgi:HD-GYP domain-containing protein (c-di-GMP phosphodiesterase class II)